MNPASSHRRGQRRIASRVAPSATWAPDDPRIDQLATDLADHYLVHPDLLPIPAALQARDDGAIRYKCSAITARSTGRPGPG
jgi:hypothetical protein